MKLVDALTLTLKDLGVHCVFGVSGANIEHFHDAIYRLGDDKLTAILAKSEYAAAFMADGLARAHNTLGVCCSTSGGGMMNLAVGIAESYADNVPVLAIVGQIPMAQEGNGGFQDSSGKNGTMNALHFWSSITKYTAKIDEPLLFWSQFKCALQHIFHQQPGPAVLLIPRDLFEREVPERPDDFPMSLSAYKTLHHPSTQHMTQHITALIHSISQARHPLLILGAGLRYIKTTKHLHKLVDHFNVKVATTLADVNAFPQTDPHYLGMLGIAGHPSVHHYLKHHVDLIIAVGEEFSTMVKTPIASVLSTIKTIHIGIHASKIPAATHVHLLIEGDIETILEQIVYPQPHPSEPPQPVLIPKQVYLPLMSDQDAQGIGIKQSAGINTREALAVLQPFLTHAQHAIFDAGNCVVSALHYLTFTPKLKTIISLGMGGMGYAIPAGIGVQLGALNHQKTCVITGDGGFLMSGLEIHTAVDHQLPILFIVFNNNRHGMCVSRQKAYFSHRITASTYGKLEVAKTVRGLGNKQQLWVACARNTTDLEQQLTDYYQRFAEKPGVLEIKINPDEITPFIPFLNDLVAQKKLW